MGQESESGLAESSAQGLKRLKAHVLGGCDSSLGLWVIQRLVAHWWLIELISLWLYDWHSPFVASCHPEMTFTSWRPPVAPCHMAPRGSSQHDNCLLVGQQGLIPLKLHRLISAPLLRSGLPRLISIWLTPSQLISDPITGAKSSHFPSYS